MHPLVFIALLVALISIFVLPRKYAVVWVLVMAFLIPTAQQFYVGGLHVFVLRIAILAALIRALFSMIFSHVRAFSGGISSLDILFMIWTAFHVITFLILFSFVPAALVNQFGFIWDFLGGFLVLRFFIRDQEDIERVLRTFAFIATVLALCMIYEHVRVVNLFGYLGGIAIQPEIRDGLVRAKGAFAHPLLAGTFGATLVPLFLWYWHIGKSKVVATIGVLSGTTMAICASSSTPLLALAAGIGTLCFWPFRKYMRMLRWGVVVALVVLQVVMKAPVWYLISHIQVMGASSSSHRAELVDMFIRHFSDWWLIGTNSNGEWGFDMWDTSNQFVGEGIGGGLGTFVCFIAMISVCFSRIGKARKAAEGDPAKEWYYWFFGAALFSHIVAFFGISYFDQTRMAWFALLVMIVTVTAPALAAPVAETSDVAPIAETELLPAGSLVPDRPPLPTHPWLNTPPRKNLLGQPARGFKARRS